VDEEKGNAKAAGDDRKHHSNPGGRACGPDRRKKTMIRSEGIPIVAARLMEAMRTTRTRNGAPRSNTGRTTR
jgi:hypothetical protein